MPTPTCAACIIPIVGGGNECMVREVVGVRCNEVVDPLLPHVHPVEFLL